MAIVPATAMIRKSIRRSTSRCPPNVKRSCLFSFAISFFLLPVRGYCFLFFLRVIIWCIFIGILVFRFFLDFIYTFLELSDSLTKPMHHFRKFLASK